MPMGMKTWWLCVKSRQIPKTKKKNAIDTAPKLGLKPCFFTARINTYNKYMPPMSINANGTTVLGNAPLVVTNIAMRSKVSGARKNFINFMRHPKFPIEGFFVRLAKSCAGCPTMIYTANGCIIAPIGRLDSIQAV